MTTTQDISMEYIHALADALMDLTCDNPKINALVALIYRESEPRKQEERKQ
mgnify:CR=1 FL=1